MTAATEPDASACEALVRRKIEEGDPAAAATEALRFYGPEVLGYLLAVHRDEDDADDAFASFGEKLWRALPRFRFECALRSFCYRLARIASADVRRAQGAVARRKAPLSDCPEVAEMVAQIRTATRSYLRTDARSAADEIRRSLSYEEQTLLILRLERKLSWTDLARVFLEDQGVPSDDAIKRESARLRKRFQIVKERLVDLGKQRGLFVRDGKAG